MTYKYIQLGYLDTVAGDDQELRKTLLEMVQQELSSAVPDMAEAYEAEKWEELHEIVHKLKSTLAFVGNPELININQNMLTHLEEKNYQADYSTWLSEYHSIAEPIQKELIQALEH